MYVEVDSKGVRPRRMEMTLEFRVKYTDTSTVTENSEFNVLAYGVGSGLTTYLVV